MTIASLRTAITAAGGTPTSNFRLNCYRDLLASTGGPVAYHTEIDLLQALIRVRGGLTSSVSKSTLLRQYVTILGGTPKNSDTDALEAQIAVLIANGALKDLAPEISIDNPSAREADGRLTFTLTRKGSLTRETTVGFATSPGTTVADDFVAVSGRIKFAPGDVTHVLEVQVVDDKLVEFDETVQVLLTGATNGVITKELGIGTIINDDAAPAAPAPTPPPPAPLPTSTTDRFGVVPFGGGGFVVAGKRRGRVEIGGTDTAQSQLRAAPDQDWAGLLTEANIPDMSQLTTPPGLSDGIGSYTQDVTESGVAYTTLHGYLIRSDDLFKSRARVVFGPKRMLENTGPQRLWNSKMDLDEANPNIMVIGCAGKGEYGGAYSCVDGKIFERIAGLPDPEDYNGYPAPILVSKDPTNPKNWALAIHGHGIYLSTTGANGQYLLSQGSSKLCHHLHYDAFGRLWTVDYGWDSATAIKTYENGLWRAAPLVAPRGYQCVAVNPRNRDHVVALGPNMEVYRTVKGTDGKWTWQDFENAIWPSAQPYHCPRRLWQDSKGGRHTGLYPSQILFDPLIANRCHVYHGTGTLYFDPPTAWGGIEFFDTTPRIEQICSNGGLSIPGGKHWLHGWDKGFQDFTDFLKPCDRTYPEDIGFTHCWSMDYSPSRRLTVALCNSEGEHFSSYSLDGGRFVQFKHQIPEPWAFGGSISAVNDTTVIWVPHNNGRAYYTTDLGDNPWKPIDLGVPMPAQGQESGWSYAKYFLKRSVIASKETPGRVWMANYGPTLHPHLAGIWMQDNFPNGKWEQVHKGRLPEWIWLLFHNFKFKEVPGHANFLLAAGGHGHDEPLLGSRDGGRTWKPIGSGVAGVLDFDFGAPARAGAKYPCVRFYGNVNGRPGVYEIDDLDTPVFKFITTYVDGMVTDSVRTISGDMNVHRKWSYGFGGSGARYSLPQ